jgi:hypothetical protein
MRYRKWIQYLAALLASFAGVWCIHAATGPADKVVLMLGEPYEKVRWQSRSTLPVATKENSINLQVTRPTALHFNDPKYGFVTPPAKFLSLYADQHGNVSIVTLSPQVKTLPLDKAMAITLDLQQQLERRGWHPVRTRRFVPIANTPAMVDSIRRGDDPQSVWQVADKYQIVFDIRRYVHGNRPDDERYLVTLELSGPPLTISQPNR